MKILNPGIDIQITSPKYKFNADIDILCLLNNKLTAITAMNLKNSRESQELASWAINRAFNDLCGNKLDQTAFLYHDLVKDRDDPECNQKNCYQLIVSNSDRFRDFLHHRDIYRMKFGV